jgi:hypothetical protein
VLRRGAAQAASAAVGTAIVTIAIAGIPALVGFALNGATITWTMPDYALMFFTFLTLLQITGIGIASIALAAISAIAAWRFSA